MNYELLQRHGAVNVECEEPAGEPWLSPIDDVGNAGIYNIPKSPNVYRVTFELDGTGMYKLEHALKLLEKYDPVGFEERPEDIDCWDDVCDEDAHTVGDCDDNDLTMLRPNGCNDNVCMMQTIEPADEEWDEECTGERFKDLEEDKALIMPANHKYILKYR